MFEGPSLPGGILCYLLTMSSFDLPDDVFQPGETRPQRPTKKKVVRKTESAGQKRRMDDLDVSLQKRPR